MQKIIIKYQNAIYKIYTIGHPPGSLSSLSDDRNTDRANCRFASVARVSAGNQKDTVAFDVLFIKRSESNLLRNRSKCCIPKIEIIKLIEFLFNNENLSSNGPEPR